MFQQLHVLLRPGEIRVTRRASPLGRAGVERVFVVPAGQGGSVEPWRAGLQRLAEALNQPGSRGGTLHLVVSDHFVRYALVPWSADLVSDAERIALARVTMHDTFGAAADGWDIALDEQPAGCASFACAVDRDLLGGVRDLAKALGLRLASVVPALADRINRHRRAMVQRTLCVASIEPGRLTLAFRHAGAWLAVRGRRVQGSPADGLAGALIQEAAASGVPGGGALYLVGEDVAALPPFTIPGWSVVRLSDGSATPPRGLAAAQAA